LNLTQQIEGVDMVANGGARRVEIVVPRGQELLPILDEIDGQAVVRYFAPDEDADAMNGEVSIAEALATLGSWGNLDWEETVEELDRIRRQSKPTPQF
jgi:hypothetical protein